jgi:K+-transporting ATPase KdpF subunit
LVRTGGRMDFLLLVVAVAVAIYLVVAMVRPEVF